MRFNTEWANRMAQRAASVIVDHSLTEYVSIHQIILNTITSDVTRNMGKDGYPKYHSGIPGAMHFTVDDVLNTEQRRAERGLVEQAIMFVFNRHAELIQEYVKALPESRRGTSGHRIEHAHVISDLFVKTPQRRMITELIFGSQFAFERAGFSCTSSTSVLDRSQEASDTRTAARMNGDVPIPDVLRVIVSW